MAIRDSSGRKPKWFRLPFLAAAVSLAAGAVAALSDGDWGLGIASMLMVFLNLGALKFAERHARTVHLVLNLANAGLSFLLAGEFWARGKKGLPYAWAIVGMALLAAAWIGYKRTGPASPEKGTLDDKVGDRG